MSDRDEAVRIAVEGCVLYREETGKLMLVSLDDPCWTELLRVAAGHRVVQTRVIEAISRYGEMQGDHRAGNERLELNRGYVVYHEMNELADAIASGAVTLDTEGK